MAEGGTSHNSSEGVFDFICQPCSSDGQTLEAVGYCVDCVEFLCNECYTYHLRPSPMKHHTLVSTEEAANAKVVKDICQEKCPDHHGKVVEYYCEDHECLGCTVCMTLHHGKCDRKKYIPDVSEEKAKSEEYIAQIKTLETLILQAKCLKQASNVQKCKSEEVGTKALKDFTQIKTEVIDILDKLEIEIVSEISERMSRDNQNFEENIIVIDDVLKKAETLKHSLEQMKVKEKFCQVFVDLKRNRSDIISFNKQLEKSLKNGISSEYQFLPCSQLEEFVKHKGRHGNLTEITHTNKQTKALFSSDIGLKDSSKCSILGIVCLKSERLLFVDIANSKVKLADIASLKVTAEYSPTSTPKGVATTETGDTLAVTLYGEKKILLLKVEGNKLIMDREIPTSDKCWSIACVADNFIVGVEDPERLEIIDNHGHVLNKVVNNENGEAIFHDIYCTMFNAKNASIYVADYSANRLTRLSLFGNVLNSCQLECLEQAHSLGVDKNGYVFVGSMKTSKVFLFSPDCKLIGEIQFEKGGLHSFRSLCFCEKTNKMFVGQYDDKINVYHLETVIKV